MAVAVVVRSGGCRKLQVAAYDRRRDACTPEDARRFVPVVSAARVDTL
jgi:hypothetical protein